MNWATSAKSIGRLMCLGMAAPISMYSSVTAISSVRLRWTAFQYDNKKANTPTANSTMAVIAPTHWAKLENETAANVAVTAKIAVNPRSACTILSRAFHGHRLRSDANDAPSRAASTSYEYSASARRRDADTHAGAQFGIVEQIG